VCFSTHILAKRLLNQNCGDCKESVFLSLGVRPSWMLQPKTHQFTPAENATGVWTSGNGSSSDNWSNSVSSMGRAVVLGRDRQQERCGGYGTAGWACPCDGAVISVREASNPPQRRCTAAWWRVTGSFFLPCLFTSAYINVACR